MTTLDDVRRLVTLDHGLAVVSVPRADGTIASSVVNAGVLDHEGTPVVAFVAAGSAVKLSRLRRQPHATVTLRAGWEWASVDGPVTLIGPDDPRAGVDVPSLLRAVFTAAGGTHEDWDTFDRVMAEERRAAVLVTPTRIYGVTR
jgi:PPOX class probable F420-dependent enzyme